MESILQMGGFGAVMQDPSGRWVAFERIRPYHQMTDYSFRSYAFAKSGHQIWIHDLQSTEGPQLLPGVDPEPHSYLLGFSPSGRFLAFLQYDLGEISLGFHDLVAGKVTIFSEALAISRGGDFVPVWTRDDQFIFTAMSDGRMPLETSLRARIGGVLTEGWRAAWRGDSVTAREVSTRLSAGDRNDRSGRLLKVDPSSGAFSELLPTGVSGLQLSPDGDVLAGLSEEGDAAPGAGSQVGFPLVLVDPDSGASRSVAPEYVFVSSSIVWHPDGKFLAAFGWKNGQNNEAAGFFRIDPVSGEVLPFNQNGLQLISEQERGWLDRPERALFLGDRLAVYARSAAAENDAALTRDGWFALSIEACPDPINETGQSAAPVPHFVGEDYIGLQVEGALVRYQADGSFGSAVSLPKTGLRRVEAGTILARSGLARPDLSGEGLFAVSEGARRKAVFAKMDADAGLPVTLDIPDRAIVVAGSMRAATVLSLVHRDYVTDLVLSQSDRPAQILSSVNLHLENAGAGDWRVTEYEHVQDGRTVRLKSCILLPEGFRSDRPPPLVVDIYPGAAPDCLKPDWRPLSYPDPNSPYIWAERGYAYSRLSLPAEFLRDETGPLGHLPALVKSGVQAHISAQRADADRLILHGFSMGAIGALYTAAHTSGYDAVIARHGWMDPYSHYFGTPGTISLIDDGYFGAFSRYEGSSLFAISGTPFEQIDAYLRSSPVFAARQLEAPVLLIASDLDTFDIGQSDSMYAALLRAGKDAVYVRYLGEGHGVSSPANIRDMWDRTFRFLEDRGIAP